MKHMRKVSVEKAVLGFDFTGGAQAGKTDSGASAGGSGDVTVSLPGDKSFSASGSGSAGTE